jgi:7,8-dihydropterin-6-yl-methyl-4-(beta-D-ribofuranosyl)aminobenzene 5'-phosphate synthase
MNIKILYDNYTERETILKGWGFSCLVGNKILFDTGESGESLSHNIREMGVILDQVKAVVISHDHWDHTGGLWEILKRKKGIKVYVCPGFSEEFKNKVRDLSGRLIECDNFIEIIGNIYVTGAILGKYKGLPIEEQGLAVKTARGITVVAGCAHPGIVKIVKKIKEEFLKEKLYSVFGGFHLKDKQREEIAEVIKELKELGVENVGPTHCTGEEAKNIFREEFEKNYIEIAAGKVFEV